MLLRVPASLLGAESVFLPLRPRAVMIVAALLAPLVFREAFVEQYVILVILLAKTT